MEGPEENYIYPSAFNPCILRCVLKNGIPTTTLYMEHTCDTKYVQLAFAEDVFEEDDILFKCDLMEAKDGGFPYLIIQDILKMREKNWKEVKPMVRYELIKMLFYDPTYFDINSTDNGFRVRLPILFDVSQIHEVYDFILPNFYGVVHGVNFIKDTHSQVSKSKDNQYIIRKTSLPEVYELYMDGIQPLPGNNIAYIPTMELSRKLKELLSQRNSAKVSCILNEERQKWIPVI